MVSRKKRCKSSGRRLKEYQKCSRSEGGLSLQPFFLGLGGAREGLDEVQQRDLALHKERNVGWKVFVFYLILCVSFVSFQENAMFMLGRMGK